MTYKIRITSRADAEIDEFLNYVACTKQQPSNAAMLSAAINRSIDTLTTLPHRCPEAPESEFVAPTVRMLIVKRTLLVLYTVSDADKLVTIQGFRHGSRSPLDLSGSIDN
jgi:hypothetical protein